MSATYGMGGAQGGVFASYDVPHIARNSESEPGDTVAHEYSYPTTADPFNAEARSNFVEVENLGEGWIDDADAWDAMLDVELEPDFKGMQKIGTLTVPFYPTASASISCSSYSLDV